MLRIQLHRPAAPSAAHPLRRPFPSSLDGSSLQLPRSASAARRRQCGRSHRGYRVVCSVPAGTGAQTLTGAPLTSDVEVRAVVRLQVDGSLLSNLSLKDFWTELRGTGLLLQIVSSELDPKTGKEKKPIAVYAKHTKSDDGHLEYEATFKVKAGFGEIGAVQVEIEHNKEVYLKDIVLSGFPDSDMKISCHSWLQPKGNGSEKRVFFANKSYLPSQTPAGLKNLRAKELVALRGNGTGERKAADRIYDYDVYNDLADPDTSAALARPVLGGKEHPYPRRCRTGRRASASDSRTESRGKFWYIPRDESFSEIKDNTFSINTLQSVLHGLVPVLKSKVRNQEGFPHFTAIDTLFGEGLTLAAEGEGILQKLLLPRIIKNVREKAQDVLLFEPPELLDRDKFAWIRDEEFARQTLAGLNPLSIELLRELPIKSTLDPKVYGSAESLITKELIEREIKGYMTVEEAMEKKRIFILDYHDKFLPYVHKVRALDGVSFYASRTVFFHGDDGTLRPIAIELTRPKSDLVPQWRQVFTRTYDGTGSWLWKLAKAHVLSHDSGWHQLVSHWLRTHACMEPYVIAANRTLSAMHPVHRLLRPHFRYTMEINVLAREKLINAGGVIESCFTPGKYSIELSSVAYDKFWRFDTEALPADLIARGMAVEDPTAENGLRLTIEDYPYANDALLLWSAIKQWVEDYVTNYYPDDDLVKSDDELQQFWTEVRTKGHADKKDEPWWPSMNSKDNLVHILTTIIWVASAHHAAVNFGQYHYAGYFPNRATITRKAMPVEDGNERELETFLEKPEITLLETFPAQLQAVQVMAVLDVLSSHSIDEEYIGKLPGDEWGDAVVRAAYERFYGRMKEIEGIIDGRNLDQSLKNRCGAGVVPYELLKPYSEPGVTGMGVPNSISI